MLANTTQIYLTDKNGYVGFKTLCPTVYAASERRNLERHIMQARATPARYSFLDVASVRVVQVDANAMPDSMTDDEILTALGA